MNIKLPPALAARLEEVEIGNVGIDPHRYAQDLAALVGDSNRLSDEERLGCVAEISCWQFVPIRGDDRQPWGCYFGPTFSGTTQDGQQFHHPDAKLIPKAVIEYWAKRAEESLHPLVRARLGDLAWEIGTIWSRDYPDEKIKWPKELVLRTIDAYIESVTSVQEYDAWRHLNRALELALLVKDKSRIEQAKQTAFAYARSRQDHPRANHWWDIHTLVWDIRGLALTVGEETELIGWLDQVLARHSDISDAKQFDPHRAMNAAEMLRLWHHKSGQIGKAIDAVKKAGVAFEAMADVDDPLMATAWLEDLSIKYRRDKLFDDAARVEAGIRVRAQAAEAAVVQHEICYEVQPEVMEAWLSALMAGSLVQALIRIAATFVRSEDDLRKMLLRTAEHAPLISSIPIAIKGPQGFTTVRIGSLEADMPGRVVHLASTLIGQDAPWLGVVFERARRDWQLSSSNLFQWFVESSLFSPVGHGLLRQGLDAWESGDCVKAVHLLVPQVESAIREWMFALGESPMKFNDKDGGFESKGLGEMLHSQAIKKHVHADLHHHLRCLYTHPKGLNLRNRIAHGWAGEELVGWAMANWIVHSLIAIRTHGHTNQSSASSVG
ncbi:DUF4209 domain-containing protein [Leptothrix ochracea]|uniref:DUF4209 domain-containing protein n=1 Tax=Leptothrix ochracea TaxID=735331 RepID=UPI0034E1F73E